MGNETRILCLCTALAWLGCSSSGESGSQAASSGGAAGSGETGGASGGSNATSGGSGGEILGLNIGDASVGAGGGGTGIAEVCDGVDNDGNGIVDDVDVGQDGVCDCLNIATIGQIGPWGAGAGIFSTWLSARSPKGAVALGDQVLTDDLLKPFQVIVLLHVATMVAGNGQQTAAAHHAFSDAEVQAFKNWVAGGGGAMSTIGYVRGRGEETNVNLLLAPIGITYKPGGYTTDYVKNWVTHPVTQGVTNIFMQNGIEPAGEGIILARDSSNRIALQVIESGAGHAVMWGDEWITYDDLWKDIQDQQVERFWLNILKWLSPPKQCQVPIPARIN